MEEKQIIEGNKLIAEFDGWKVEPFDIDASEDNITGDDDWLVLNQYDSSGKRVRQIDGWECANIEANELETLPYNTSWDWLMPVAQKIKDYLQDLDRPSQNHCCKGDLLEVDIQCHIWGFNLTKAHEAVYEWVLWHNSDQPITNK